MRRCVVAALLAAACSRDLSLPPVSASGAGSVFGRAVYTPPGSSAVQPAAGALITLSSSTVSTTAAADGTFDVEGISSASGQLLFQLDADDDGTFDRQRAISLREIGARPGRQIGVGDVVIGQSATLHGAVVRQELQGIAGGHAGTLVFVPLTSFSTWSAADGRYVLDGLPAGPIELGFFRAGYAPARLSDLQLRPAEDFAVGQVVLAPDDGSHAGGLAGAVTYQPETASLGGATVIATNASTGAASSVQSGDDGAFGFATLPAGLYDVAASRTGYTTVQVPNVLVFEGQTTSLQLALGQGSTLDAGRPPVPDAGPPVACALTRDCAAGQWCDQGVCVPLCGAAVACTSGRVCDPATHTCVQPCGASCPSGQGCHGATQVCRALCDGSLPCAPGSKCAANYCVPECAAPADCPSVHQTCQAGQCVPDGTCADDLDCLSAQLCVGTVCAPRPIAGADAGWPCVRPCDCRLGEWCHDGTCAADRVPTRVLGSDGGSLAASLGAARPGDFIALVAGDTFWADDGFTVATPQLGVSGGYVSCGANRWVYDPARNTTLVSDSGTALRLPGSIAAPLPDVTLRGLTLRAGANPTCNVATDVLSASSAPRLRLLSVSGNSFGPHCGIVNVVHVRDSDDLLLDGVSVLPADMPGDSRGVLLERCSARVTGFVGPQLIGPTWRAISVLSPSGETRISGAAFDKIDGTGVMSIFAQTCGSNRFEVTDSTFVPSSGHTVWVEGCLNVDVHDNVFDGAPQAVYAGYTYFYASGSAGTFSRNRLIMVANPGGSSLVELRASGAWALEDLSFEGCGVRPADKLFYFVSTTGPTRIARASVGAPDSGTASGFCAGRAVDLLTATNVSITDSYFKAVEPIVVSPGSLLIERSVFIGDKPLSATNAQLESYSSFFSSTAGPAWDVIGGQVYAVGNTIDGAGSVAAGTTTGFRCANSAAVFFTSNLVNGGLGVPHFMLYDGNSGGTCFTPANYDHNWFYSSGLGGRSAGDAIVNVTSSFDGGADARGNVVGEGVGCYPPGLSPPSGVLPAGSPCIDRGASRLKPNGTAVDKDVEGRPRSQGAAPDIGAYERQ